MSTACSPSGAVGKSWPSRRMSAPGSARSPSCTTCPASVTRPSRIHCSISRREPWPAVASSFCTLSGTRIPSLARRQADLPEQLGLSVPIARLAGPIDQAAREVRAEQLHELVGEIAQQRAAPEADPGGVDREEVRGL